MDNYIRVDYVQLSSAEDFIELAVYFCSPREWIQFTGEKSHDGVILDASFCFE